MSRELLIEKMARASWNSRFEVQWDDYLTPGDPRRKEAHDAERALIRAAFALLADPANAAAFAKERDDKGERADARTLQEIIGDAAADCEAVTIAGDVYALGPAIIAALSAQGLVIVPQYATFSATSSRSQQVREER